MKTESRRSWWLALAALAVCGPWPGWEPPLPAVAVVVVGLLALARPTGMRLLPWMAVLLGLVGAALKPNPALDAERLGQQLDDHCRQMLAVAGDVALEPELQRLFSASGETLDPALPFNVLRGGVEGQGARSVYLADDRGRLVAWAGEQRAFPEGVRALGQRQWGVLWSAGSGALWVREPILLEGRLAGAVTVVDRSGREATQAWGMRSNRGCRLRLGYAGDGAVEVRAAVSPVVQVPVTSAPAEPVRGLGLEWLAWLVLAVLAVAMAPGVGWAVVVVGGAAFEVAPGGAEDWARACLVLLGGAAAGRLAARLPGGWARLLVVAVVGAAAAFSALGAGGEAVGWLPNHLLRPGWGGVWMVAVAWVAAGWPGSSAAGGLSLARRLSRAAALAAVALSLQVVRLPLSLSRVATSSSGVVLPRGELDLGELLPTAAEMSRLDDLAPVLAKRWGLDRWSTPSQLTLISDEGQPLSRWGDLGPAGEAVRALPRWSLPELGASLELAVAVQPWSWLRDWRSGEAREASTRAAVWFAVLDRSGAVAATVHPEIRGLDAMAAGALFHAGGGWTWLKVGDAARLARVWRRGEWLVAAIARHPAPSVWVVQVAVSILWALLGLTLARPPALRREQLSTFGGRLRLLVAGGIVLPLVILSLLLNLRLQREEARLDNVTALDALRPALYAGVYLAGGFEVDDDLARWLSPMVGGEVALFDGAQVVAVSRPDLMSIGVLPELPAAAVFPGYLLGRSEPTVVRQGGRLVGAGAVEVQGRRLLLQVFPEDPRLEEAPAAGDWLLTGAVLSALLALVLTARVERRLSASLRDLVALAGRLLHGQPMGDIRRPVETDLAEVLDAVRSMNLEVQQRELSLRSQEELLRITLSTLTPAVVVLEPGGAVRFANPSAEALLAEQGEAVLTRVRELAASAEATGGPVVETVQPLPGEDVTWRMGVAGVPLPDGSRGTVAVVDDVTDVVRADRVQQLNQLARIVAHEVKNPLTPVRLWVQELDEARRRQDPRIDELLEEACREISLQVERLQETASSFSNLVALERWEPEAVDMVELVKEAVQGLGVLERRGIRMELSLAEPGSCRVTGDRQWLRRALANLVRNSLEAIGGSEGTLWLRVQGHQTAVLVEVEDSGGGVPDSQLGSLFSPYFSTTRSGSGLGLALVHQVVERCHGRLEASNGDRGLLVRLQFPGSSARMTT